MSSSAFEDFCGGIFWNNSLSWDTAPGESPNLTPCFEDTVLVWVPCGFLWLCLPFYLYKLCGASSVFSTPVNRLQVAKRVTAALFIALTLCDVIKYIVESQQQQHPNLALLVTPLILFVTLFMSLILIILERRKGFITSGVLFMFYLLLLVAGTFKFASLALDLRSKTNDDIFRAVTFFASYSFNLLMVLLLCFAESRPDREADQKTCPELKSSFLSRITFGWITRLILDGYKSVLTEKDLFELNPRDQVHSTSPDFLRSWNKELRACNWSKHAKPANKSQPRRASENRPNQNDEANDERTPLLDSSEAMKSNPKSTEKQKKPSLFKALARVYGWDLVVAHSFKLLADVLTFAGPLIQSQVIGFIDSNIEAQWHGYLYAVLFFGVAVLQSILMQQMFHIGMSLAMRIKGVLMFAVYKKALTISNQARKNTTVGEIVNLMSVDTDRIQNVIGYLWIVWSCPLQIAVAIYLLYQLLGVAVFAGLAALFLLLPINYAVARFQQRLEVKQMGLKDNRIKLLNEVLNGIKVLKLYAWELSFKEKVDAVRNAEVANLRLYWYLGTVSVLCWTVAPFLVMLTSFTTFVLMGNVLDANTAFVSLTLFNILQFPINLLPLLVSFIVTSVVSLGRLGNFLRQPDIETGNVLSSGDEKLEVQVKNGTFAWGTEENDLPALKDINLELQKGSLVAIVGLVGSGKSSMLSAMMGEMEKLEGSVIVNGSTAYVAQQAWIQNATLRDNILFGQPFDKTKYEQVIEACALTTDLEILTAGDQTEIGEKGINLSGGQKQRVALARAVYQDLDIYLLDDPLSAVDAHVGKHIFNKVVGKKGILKNKTCILVTHGIHWLPMVDQIIVMDHGLISEMGSYEELMHHNGPFAQFLKTHLLKGADENEDDADDNDDEDDPEVAEIQRAILERVESVCSDGEANPSEILDKPLKRRLSRQASVKPATVEETKKEVEKEEKRKAEEKLIEEEQSETGRVKLSVIIAYIKALGLLSTFVILLMYTVYQAASIFGNIWLTQWTSDPVLSNSSIPANSSDFIKTRDMYLGVYGGSGIAQACFVLIYSLLLAYASVRASAQLHSAMLFSVLRSPMSFFDTTPIGRILNRFSRDVEAVDNLLPDLVIQVAASGYTVIASFFVISFSTPVFLALLIPISVLYYVIQRFFIPSSRQLKRLESNTRSPVYAHFSESVSGAATIRAFKRQQEFEDKSNQLVEHNMVFYFANICSNRWLNFRLDLLGGLVILGAVLFAVIEKDSSGGISGSVAGLSVSYALQATQELNWFVRTISEFELNIVSVERISQYMKLTPEAEWTKDSDKALANWPSQGEIEFENYSTRYRPGLSPVVKDINLHIKPQEKIGICGRTGAGKSSLTTAIFRIIESITGNIVIDNVTISSLGLKDLRSRLTILPQDPVLFSGTLRMNLDPFSTYSDVDIWWSLEKAHLKEFVERLPAGLAYECGEGGQNLSVGQRQLLCLGRALLRKTKVLVLDEATAAVDMETDSLIQNTIRTEFKDCTILTIAHRLNTIMDSDRILVLDKGQVAEFDTPNKLLAKDTSLLYKMAKEAGIV